VDFSGAPVTHKNWRVIRTEAYPTCPVGRCHILITENALHLVIGYSYAVDLHLVILSYAIAANEVLNVDELSVARPVIKTVVAPSQLGLDSGIEVIEQQNALIQAKCAEIATIGRDFNTEDIFRIVQLGHLIGLKVQSIMGDGFHSPSIFTKKNGTSIGGPIR